MVAIKPAKRPGLLAGAISAAGVAATTGVAAATGVGLGITPGVGFTRTMGNTRYVVGALCSAETGVWVAGVCLVRNLGFA